MKQHGRGYVPITSQTAAHFNSTCCPANHNPPPGLSSTLEGWKQGIAGLYVAFPDLHIHLEDEIYEDDRIVARFTSHGTHQGETLGIPGTGQEVSVAGIFILRLADDKTVEIREQVDTMAFMIQLGAIPPPGG